MLKQKTRTQFTVDARQIDLLTRWPVLLLQVSTVSYAQQALALNAEVKISFNVKRLQRFFKEFSFSHRNYLQFIWQQSANEQTVLTIDRTNRKFGRHHINVLMVGIAYWGTAIPLVCKLLCKAGNSSQRERIGLIRALLWLLTGHQKSDAQAITTDRDESDRRFVGHFWLSYLLHE